MKKNMIEAHKRSDEGKGASRRLRQAGRIPAVVYGCGAEAVSIALDHNHFMNQLDRDHSLVTSVLELQYEGKTESVLIKDIQHHPFANKLMHVDFQRVEAKTTIVKTVPLKFINKERSPGVRLGALLTPLMASLEVRCLPDKLPKILEVDCSKLEAGDSVKMSELPLPEGVELVALRKGGAAYDHAILMLGKART